MKRTTKKSLPRIVSLAKSAIVKQDDNVTVFRVLGVPYGGPEFLEGKDLHGQYFSKNTDFGWVRGQEPRVPVIARGLSFYDHAFHPKFGTEPIGTAKFYAETDDGQWWDIEVERSYRYHDFLLSLAQKNFLGASSQPIQTSVEIDWENGEIKRWHSAEISLTPTPANPNAVVELAKAHNLDPEMIADIGKRRLNVKTFVKMDIEVPMFEDEVEEDEEETAEEGDFAQEIESYFAAEEEETVEETPEEAQDEADAEEEVAVPAEVSETLKAILDRLTALETELKAVRSESQTRDQALLSETTQIKAGIKTFSKNVADQLKISVKSVAREVAEESEAEREAEELRRSTPAAKSRSHFAGRSSEIPDGVPGRN